MEKENIQKSNNLRIFRYVFGGFWIICGMGATSQGFYLNGPLWILFGLSLQPIVYKLISKKINPSIIKKISIILPIILFGLMLVLSTTNEESSKTDKSNSNQTTEEKDKNENYNKANLKIIKNEKLKNNFIEACEQIKMDPTKIKDVKKTEDWRAGPRYTFTYKSTQFILYALDDGTVSSIKIVNKNLDNIYMDGYEPYNVNDYLLTADIIANLQIIAENSIKDVLNHPETAKFKWLSSGSYSRHNNIYAISGIFNAKNSFGVKKESNFYIEEELIEGRLAVVYMVIDNQKYVGNNPQFSEDNRKEIIKKDAVDESTDRNIILKEGEKGKYGKDDLFDGEKYIRYYIPAGKYEVTAKTRNSTFFIESIELHKESGYDTATEYRKIILAKIGDKDTIDITSNQCISLVAYTTIQLTKIEG